MSPCIEQAQQLSIAFSFQVLGKKQENKYVPWLHDKALSFRRFLMPYAAGMLAVERWLWCLLLQK